MAYEKHTWSCGETVTANQLNHMEDGISQLDTDAQSTREDIDVLEARMDTFASLPPGSTAGNAELIDIRVGADGVTYPTAGDAVRTQFANLKENSGISDEVKVALLNCFEHVAWIDEHGQDYYDALENALNRSEEKTPVSITAVFSQGQNTIYTDDTLESLRQYLTVTAQYEDSSTRVISDYTLSGQLTSGVSVITVYYKGKSTTFNVTVTQRIYTYGWNTSAQGSLQKVNGSPIVGDRHNHMNLNTSATMIAARRAFVVTSGDLPYTVYQDGSETGYYPIPIPPKANRVTISIEPSARYVIGNFALLNENKTSYTNVETIDPFAGSKTISFEAGERSHLVVGTKYASEGTPEYAEEPTLFSVTFEEV